MFLAWKERLASLPLSGPVVRETMRTVGDGQSMQWIQAVDESAYINDVDGNISTMSEKTVMLAEVDGIPVGFSVSLLGRWDPQTLFVQRVLVAPLARRRGIGLALLTAAAEQHPGRDIAVAALDENDAVHKLNHRFAESIGASIRRVPVRTYARTDLGFAQQESHRPWVIERLRGAA